MPRQVSFNPYGVVVGNSHYQTFFHIPKGTDNLEKKTVSSFSLGLLFVKIAIFI
jgi:hypothetical protein